MTDFYVMRVGLNCSSSLTSKRVANRKMLIIQMFTLEAKVFIDEKTKLSCAHLVLHFILFWFTEVNVE